MSDTLPLDRPRHLLTINIVVPHPVHLWRRQLFMPAGSTVGEALSASGYLVDHPEASFSNIVMGVYGKRVSLCYQLSDFDRIEIYTPLIVDPKVARRRRAAHRSKAKNSTKKSSVNDLSQANTR